LFAVRKVGQRKTLFGQRKTLSGQRKHFPVKENFGLVSRKVFSLLAVFVFRKVVSSGFRETTFQTLQCLFAIRKVGQRKTLSS